MWLPQDQVYWYQSAQTIERLKAIKDAEVIVIGGGMAGLSAAQAFCKKGKKVVLIEQYQCGAGATGKSSGFITPNSELSLTDLTRQYSLADAKIIWDFFSSGVEDIRVTIQKHALACDYTEQNSLVVANSAAAYQELITEYEHLKKLGYSAQLYTDQTIQNKVGSSEYYGGVEYENTFGINAYQYCQELKKALQQEGVIVFEETPVTAIAGNIVQTIYGALSAAHIVVCVDRFASEIGVLPSLVYHAQTFLMISQPLSVEQIALIFPHNNLMAWDTDLIYSYFRLTRDNRLLVGGGSILTTYADKELHGYEPMYKKLTDYMHKKFPQVSLHFEYFWPGLIGISQDIAPLAGPDSINKNVYYIAACAGLPIAAALGRYSAEHILEGRTDLDRYFAFNRKFPVPQMVQTIIGKRLAFMIAGIKKLI